MKRLLALGGAAALILAACNSGGGGGGSVGSASLAALGGSGVSGTATISDVGSGKLSVVVSVSDGGNADMPSHLHTGNCDAPGEVVHPLSNVKSGAATTEIEATAAAVKELVVVLHKSADDMGTYTACGPVD